MRPQLGQQRKDMLTQSFASCFGKGTELHGAPYSNGQSLRFFSAPGRTELGGNHTDHNQGKVLAAAINLEASAAVAERSDSIVRIVSKGWQQVFSVDLQDLQAYVEEQGTTQSLLRGIAASFVRRGLKIGGFDAWLESSVLPGSGLSSSAAIEVLLGCIFSALFNADSVLPSDLALIGQEAENIYFGKPCGLMDQMACAHGGALAIDFGNPKQASIKTLDLNFANFGYRLAIVDTGGSHANLTDEYASIPSEMKSVAKFFGKEVLRELEEDTFYAALAELKTKLSHRAISRAMHFYGENRRVDQMVLALENKQIDTYLDLVNDSGSSSSLLLQNIAPSSGRAEQAICLGLGLAQRLLGKQGASRVHGGGLAGTIQAYVPDDKAEKFEREMQAVFGHGSVYLLDIRLGSAGELRS